MSMHPSLKRRNFRGKSNKSGRNPGGEIKKAKCYLIGSEPESGLGFTNSRFGNRSILPDPTY